MKIKSKLIILFIMLNLPFNLLFGQVVVCDSISTSLSVNEISLSCNNYLGVFNPPPNYILVVDHHMVDSINKYTVSATAGFLEMFYKTPDCYIVESGILVYLYTPDYRTRKSNAYRESLLETTTRILKLPEVMVNWEKDSIININGGYMLGGMYDPPFIEYSVFKGKILEIRKVHEMHYPDNNQPKGIPVDPIRSRKFRSYK